MKRFGRILVLGAALCLCAVPVFSQDVSIEKIRDTMDEFTGSLAESLPFNSSLGLNWADAHIKNFPHFGVGLSLGFSTMEMSSIDELLACFGPALPDFVSGFGGFPVPGYTAEGRLGGFILPFDVGFKFGIMPVKTLEENEKLDYLLVGGDVRYAIVKENVVLPAISVGVGFNYLSGELGMKAGEDRRIDFPNGSGGTETITLGAPKLNLNWSTAVLDFKAQISKSFFIITPYLGVGASNGWSKAGYGIKSDITSSSSDFNQIKDIFAKYGIYDLDKTGFSSEAEFSGWSFRVFGGMSINLALFKIDVTGMYNFIDKNYGISLGTRLQI